MKILIYQIAVFTTFLCFPCFAQSERATDSGDNMRVMVISDLNDSYGSITYSSDVREVVAKIDSIKPDIILCGGDMVAGQKASLTRQEIRAMWHGFAREVFDPITLRGIPFAFTMGNHDASPNFKNDRAEASIFWKEQKDKTNLDFVDDTNYPYYFSYRQNDVFFISWDASSSIIPANVVSWMEQQLTSTLATSARARVVMGHLPLYAIVESKNKTGEVLDRADQTIAFLKRYNVQIYVSGHQHAYFPGVKNNVILLHNGCLGGGPRRLLGQSLEGSKSYSIIDIPKGSGVDFRAIRGFYAEDHQQIPHRNLPDSITGFNGVVYRSDLGQQK
ncbi:metallophosphoesterase [Sphingobacterium shayense]|uniref:metallophosphoesterase family protein n=1 Tax=Sphingobacterium shayense TaxID=626343 RepID=UPI0015576F05|nr:metallophosphoesterase [Sphingobacterium shayense]NQD69784.1 metallophosphoesterase [Sphingobacterium shayense]